MANIGKMALAPATPRFGAIVTITGELISISGSASEILEAVIENGIIPKQLEESGIRQEGSLYRTCLKNWIFGCAKASGLKFFRGGLY